MALTIESVEPPCHNAAMAWTVILVDEVTDWYFDLVDHEPETAESIAVAINALEAGIARAERNPHPVRF